MQTWIESHMASIYKYALGEPRTAPLARSIGLLGIAEQVWKGFQDKKIESANSDEISELLIGRDLAFFLPAYRDEIQRFWSTDRGITYSPTYSKVTRSVVDDLWGHSPPLSAVVGRDYFLPGEFYYFDLRGCGLSTTSGGEVASMWCLNTGKVQHLITVFRHNYSSRSLCLLFSIHSDYREGTFVGSIEEADSIGDNITNLFLLLVLFHRERSKESKTVSQTTPSELSRMRPDKQIDKLRNFSLFKVERLDQRTRLTPRPASEPTGYRLDHRYKVRGHFRWQPHGPGHSLRRLQWIDAHEKGPADALLKHDLVIL